MGLSVWSPAYPAVDSFPIGQWALQTADCMHGDLPEDWLFQAGRFNFWFVCLPLPKATPFVLVLLAANHRTNFTTNLYCSFLC